MMTLTGLPWILEVLNLSVTFYGVLPGLFFLALQLKSCEDSNEVTIKFDGL